MQLLHDFLAKPLQGFPSRWYKGNFCKEYRGKEKPHQTLRSDGAKVRRDAPWLRGDVSPLMLLQSSECSLVVGFVRDLGDEFCVEDLPSLVNDYDSAG